MLFLSARSQLVSEIIKPAIKSNKVILCDRYIDSTIAYQGFGREISINILKSFNSFATNNIEPDLTFILDISINTCIDRLSNTNTDRMENSGKEFLEKVRNGYKKISKINTRYRYIDCNLKDMERISNEIRKSINLFYKGEFSIRLYIFEHSLYTFFDNFRFI